MCKCTHVSMLEEGGAKEGLMHVRCLEISVLHTHTRTTFYLTLSPACVHFVPGFLSPQPLSLHKKVLSFCFGAYPFSLSLTYSLISIYFLLLSFSRFHIIFIIARALDSISNQREAYYNYLSIYCPCCHAITQSHTYTLLYITFTRTNNQTTT